VFSKWNGFMIIKYRLWFFYYLFHTIFILSISVMHDGNLKKWKNRTRHSYLTCRYYFFNEADVFRSTNLIKTFYDSLITCIVGVLSYSSLGLAHKNHAKCPYPRRCLHLSEQSFYINSRLPTCFVSHNKSANFGHFSSDGSKMTFAHYQLTRIFSSVFNWIGLHQLLWLHFLLEFILCPSFYI